MTEKEKANMWANIDGKGEDAVGKQLRALNATIASYEHDNQKLRIAVEGLEVVKEKQQERIVAYEKKQQQLYKKILSVEASMKLERKGFEGMMKKSGLLELEVPGLKEEIVNFKTDQVRNRAQLVQYEVDLNNDRAKRLQVLHENQVLTDKYKEIQEVIKQKEQELLMSHSSQLTHLQSLDSSQSASSTLQAIITEQNNSIIIMCAELQTLQTQNRELNAVNQMNNSQVAEVLLSLKAQDEEIRRLRALILNNTASAAAATVNGNKKLQATTGTTKGRSSSSATLGTTQQILSIYGGAPSPTAGGTLSFTRTNSDVCKLNVDSPNTFSKYEKSLVYRNRVSGCDNTRGKLRGSRVNGGVGMGSRASTSKSVKTDGYGSDSGGELNRVHGEGDRDRDRGE